MWKSGIFRQNSLAISRPSSSSFQYYGLWWRHLAVQVGKTKDQGLYNKPSAAVHPGALAAGTLPQYNTIYIIKKYSHILSYTLHNQVVTLSLFSTRLHVFICDFIWSVSVNIYRHANRSRTVQKFCKEKSTIICKPEHFRTDYPWEIKNALHFTSRIPYWLLYLTTLFQTYSVKMMTFLSEIILYVSSSILRYSTGIRLDRNGKFTQIIIKERDILNGIRTLNLPETIKKR